MKTACIYVRVSSDEQVENTSPAQQEQETRHWCQRNGFNVIAVFKDLGLSGKTADRPEFLRMIKFCSCTKVDAVVVRDFKRFARDIYDHFEFQRVLSKAGTEVKSATENVDDTPAGRLFKTLICGMTQFDNEERGIRSKSGMLARAQAGYWTHQAPLGYKTARENNSPSGAPILVPDPVYGSIIFTLFTHIATGIMQVRDAHKWLANQTGLKIYAQGIHRILRQPVYAGIIKNALTNNQPIKAAFPGLITEDVFDRVQLVLKQNALIQQHRPDDTFPLRGVLKCSECGGHLTASFSKGRGNKHYSYYHCVCGMRISAPKVEQAFDVYLQKLSDECSELLPLCRLVVQDIWANVKQEAMTANAKAKDTLTQLERKQKRLLDLYLSGDVDPAMFKAKNTELDIDISTARTQIHGSEIDTMKAETVLNLADTVITTLPSVWCRTVASNRRAMAKGLFGGSITIDRNMIMSNRNKSGVINFLQKFNAPVSRMAPQAGIDYNALNDFISDLMSISPLIAA